MPVYLIRHGQSEFNAAFKHGQPDPMLFDARLSPKGQTQADALRVEVRSLGIKQVISSPLTRALETALRAFDGLAPINVMDTHHEWLTHSCDMGRPPEELAKDFPSLSFEHLKKHWWHDGPVNDDNVPVEPETTFHARVSAFDALLAKAETRPVAIVGHGNYFQELIGFMLENCQIHAYQAGGK